jgi:ATP-dependent Clp protease adaptor protein ClpS
MTLLTPDVDERTDVRVDVRPDSPWVAVVWDDPVNLMSYVTYVFQRYFGFPRGKAERLMQQVNDEGRAIVATGPREAMEAHVEAMHGYGLQASVDKAPTP